MRYYIFKHGDNDWGKIEQAIKNQCCLCQYEYSKEGEEKF